MSLINQMLRDLEKRARHSPISQENKMFFGLRSTEENFFYFNKKNKIIYSVILFLCSIIITIIFFLCYFHGVSQEFYSKKALITSNSININNFDINKSLKMHTPRNLLLHELHKTPAILTSITLQAKADMTFLRLSLSQYTLYHVNTDIKNKKITIFIENARLLTRLPKIDTVNTALVDMHLYNQKSGNVKLVFYLRKIAELIHLELIQGKNSAELQVDFSDPSALNYSKAEVMNRQINKPKNQKKEKEKEKEKEKSQNTAPASVIHLRDDLSFIDQLQEALHLAEQGNSSQAIKILMGILSRDPTNVKARESLINLWLIQGNVEQASVFIETGLKQKPYYSQYILLKARLLVSQKKFKDALKLLQISPPSLKTNPEYHALVAALYQRQGQPLLAEQLYEQLVTLQPNHPAWWIGLGIALESIGKRELASEVYTKASKMEDLTPELKAYAKARAHSLEG